MSVFHQASPNALTGTGSLGTSLTPDGMLKEYSIHNQAKAKMRILLFEFWRIRVKGTVLQCFSCLQLSLSKVGAKLQKRIGLTKLSFVSP